MKRSEMINYIMETLYPHIPFTDKKELRPVAECVLMTIEGGNPSEDRMLPPDRAHCHPELKHTDHSWEPEDE